jgi:hypothetical protein
MQRLRWTQTGLFIHHWCGCALYSIPSPERLSHSCSSSNRHSTTPDFLGTAEQELEILWAQAIHSNLVVVDCTSNHSGFLLLQSDHTRLHAIFDAETSDDARAFLTNTMASISGLPFSSRIPPTTASISNLISVKGTVLTDRL